MPIWRSQNSDFLKKEKKTITLINVPEKGSQLTGNESEGDRKRGWGHIVLWLKKTDSDSRHQQDLPRWEMQGCRGRAGEGQEATGGHGGGEVLGGQLERAAGTESGNRTKKSVAESFLLLVLHPGDLWDGVFQ